ncbi:MAG: GH109 [uncultured Thermomicrobiales bacterium]|uniref:GH109 n=1 Tax=uncultured Thermomicrobiales bacterium TaxID=1645740 RepID=A0A6J4UN62_9BACT|nr:MAG: GH109 [uncultured Thermomicrobiales bacterium]
MAEIRVGIIGVGWPGQRHIEGYQKHPDARIVAISDVNAAAAEQVKTQYNVDGARIFNDYRELLSGDHVDAVSICTPNFLHVPMAIDALDAGKHVLLEKPLAHTLQEGERLAAKVAEHPAQAFMIAFNNRYRPDSVVLKQRIEAGELGNIYYAKTGWLRGAAEFFLRGWFTQRNRSGGGPLIDLGVHMLDLSLWFMGNPRPVSVSGSVYHEFNDFMRESTGSDVDVEDLATAFIKLDNGATIVLDVSWLSHIEQSNLVYAQLFGTQGGARISRGLGNEAGGQEQMTINTTTGKGPARATLVQHPEFQTMQAQQQGFMLYESFRAEIADFVDSIEAGRQPGATITHGLDVLRVLDAIYRSAETGKEIDLRQSTAVDSGANPGAVLTTS